MRIISGRFKYRKIEVPKSARPTSEKVREALFSILYDRVQGAMVLDLFAGSGALGLEALSRGARHSIFNESDKASQLILRANIANCNALSESTIYRFDFRRLLLELDTVCDIIFIDPPYKEGLYQEIFQSLESSQVLRAGTLLCIEHSYETKLTIPESFDLLSSKRYGTIALDILSKR